MGLKEALHLTRVGEKRRMFWSKTQYRVLPELIGGKPCSMDGLLVLGNHLRLYVCGKVDQRTALVTFRQIPFNPDCALVENRFHGFCRCVVP